MRVERKTVSRVNCGVGYCGWVCEWTDVHFLPVERLATTFVSFRDLYLRIKGPIQFTYDSESHNRLRLIKKVKN